MNRQLNGGSAPLFQWALALALLCYEGGEMAQGPRRVGNMQGLNPWNTTFLSNMAGLYCQLGEIPGAISCYREIVTCRPGDAQAAANLGFLNHLEVQ